MPLKLLLFGMSSERCKEWAEADTVLEARGFGEEISYLEGHFFEHIGAHNVIQFTVEAEQRGFDAAVVGCFLDPGVKQARELVKIPVIGVGEASLHFAAMLCAGRFSVLTPSRKTLSRMVEHAQSCGFENRIASWRLLNLTVPEMMHNREAMRAATLREARLAIDEDGAEVICLGCTAMVGLAKELQDELGVPVLDPVLIGLKTAELQAKLWKRFGISHSKIGGYESPPIQDVSNAYNATYGLARKVLYHFKNKS